MPALFDDDEIEKIAPGYKESLAHGIAYQEQEAAPYIPIEQFKRTERYAKGTEDERFQMLAEQEKAATATAYLKGIPVDQVRHQYDREKRLAIGADTGWFGDKMRRVVESFGTTFTEGAEGVARAIGDGDNEVADKLQTWSKGIRDYMADNPNMDGDWASDAASGLGNLLAFGATSGTGGLVGKVLGANQKLFAGSAALAESMGLEYKQSFDQVLEATGDLTKAHEAGLLTAPAGVIDFLSDKFIMDRVLKPLKAGQVHARSDLAKAIVLSPLIEGGTEMVQGAWEDAASRAVSGDSRFNPFDLDKRIREGTVGAFLGGIGSIRPVHQYFTHPSRNIQSKADGMTEEAEKITAPEVVIDPKVSEELAKVNAEIELLDAKINDPSGNKATPEELVKHAELTKRQDELHDIILNADTGITTDKEEEASIAWGVNTDKDGKREAVLNVTGKPAEAEVRSALTELEKDASLNDEEKGVVKAKLEAMLPAPADEIVGTAIKIGDKEYRGDNPMDAHKDIFGKHKDEMLLGDIPDLNKDGGFIVKSPDGKERFVTRDEALGIGKASGQIAESEKTAHSQIIKPIGTFTKKEAQIAPPAASTPGVAPIPQSPKKSVRRASLEQEMGDLLKLRTDNPEGFLSDPSNGPRIQEIVAELSLEEETGQTPSSTQSYRTQLAPKTIIVSDKLTEPKRNEIKAALAGVKDESQRKAVEQGLEEFMPILAAYDVRVEINDGSRKGATGSAFEAQRFGFSISGNGMTILIPSEAAKSPQEVRKQTEEEAIHASAAAMLYTEWAKGDRRTSFNEHYAAKFSDLGLAVSAASTDSALQGFFGAYFKPKGLNGLKQGLADFRKNPKALKIIGEEFLRAAIQRARTGHLSEDMEKLAASKKGQPLLKKLLELLKAWRTGILRLINPKTAPASFKRVFDAVNELLDNYGVLAPPGQGTDIQKGVISNQTDGFLGAPKPKAEAKVKPKGTKGTSIDDIIKDGAKIIRRIINAVTGRAMYMGQRGTNQSGRFWSTSLSFAETYGPVAGATLAVKKPMIYTDADEWRDAFGGSGPFDDIVSEMMRGGYDSAILETTKPDGSKLYTVFVADTSIINKIKGKIKSGTKRVEPKPLTPPRPIKSTDELGKELLQEIQDQGGDRKHPKVLAKLNELIDAFHDLALSTADPQFADSVKEEFLKNPEGTFQNFKDHIAHAIGLVGDGHFESGHEWDAELSDGFILYVNGISDKLDLGIKAIRNLSGYTPLVRETKQPAAGSIVSDNRSKRDAIFANQAKLSPQQFRAMLPNFTEAEARSEHSYALARAAGRGEPLNVQAYKEYGFTPPLQYQTGEIRDGLHYVSDNFITGAAADFSEEDSGNTLDVKRFVRGLGEDFYEKDYQAVIKRELVQNATDAIDMRRGHMGKHSKWKPRIVVGSERYSTNSGVNVIGYDNGIGMSPDVVLRRLLPAYASGKNNLSIVVGGGFGMAKLVFFGSTDQFHMSTTSIHNGDLVRTTIRGTSAGWKDYLELGRANMKYVEGGEIVYTDGLRVSFETLEKNATWDDERIGTLYVGRSENITKKKDFSSLNIDWLASDVTKEHFNPYSNDFDDLLRVGMSIAAGGEALSATRALNIADMVSGGDLKVPGAKLSIRYSWAVKGRSSFAATSGWNKQFDVYFTNMLTGEGYQLVKHAPQIWVDVTPTVNADHADYPYTKSRDGLAKGAKDAMARFIQKMLDVERGNFLGQLKDAAKATSVKDSEGRDFKLFSGSVTVAPEDIEAIGKISAIQKFASAMNDLNDTIVPSLVPIFGPFTFAGVSLHSDAVGFRFGNVTKMRTDGVIYMNPILMAARAIKRHNSPDGNDPENLHVPYFKNAVDYFPGIVYELIHHEVTHQVMHDERERMARAMTFNSSYFASLFSMIQTIVSRRITEADVQSLVDDTADIQERIEKNKGTDIQDELNTRLSSGTILALASKGVHGDAGAAVPLRGGRIDTGHAEGQANAGGVSAMAGGQWLDRLIHGADAIKDVSQAGTAVEGGIQGSAAGEVGRGGIGAQEGGDAGIIGNDNEVTGAALDFRFDELTSDLPAIMTREDIDSWRASNPQKWDELKAMRVRKLIASGYDIGPVYHGTGDDFFPAFDLTKINRAGFGFGFHFSIGPSLAKIYANQWIGYKGNKTGRIMEAYLALRNPASYEDYKQALRDTKAPFGLAGELDVRTRLRKQGFDGIVYPHGKWEGVKDGEDLTFVAFKPSQIKTSDPLSPGRKIKPSEWGDMENEEIAGAAESLKDDDLEAIKSADESIAEKAEHLFPQDAIFEPGKLRQRNYYDKHEAEYGEETRYPQQSNPLTNTGASAWIDEKGGTYKAARYILEGGLLEATRATPDDASPLSFSTAVMAQLMNRLGALGDKIKYGPQSEGKFRQQAAIEETRKAIYFLNLEYQTGMGQAIQMLHKVDEFVDGERVAQDYIGGLISDMDEKFGGGRKRQRGRAIITSVRKLAGELRDKVAKKILSKGEAVAIMGRLQKRLTPKAIEKFKRNAYRTYAKGKNLAAWIKHIITGAAEDFAGSESEYYADAALRGILNEIDWGNSNKTGTPRTQEERVIRALSETIKARLKESGLIKEKKFKSDPLAKLSLVVNNEELYSDFVTRLMDSMREEAADSGSTADLRAVEESLRSRAWDTGLVQRAVKTMSTRLSINASKLVRQHYGKTEDARSAIRDGIMEAMPDLGEEQAARLSNDIEEAFDDRVKDVRNRFYSSERGVRSGLKSIGAALRKLAGEHDGDLHNIDHTFLQYLKDDIGLPDTAEMPMATEIANMWSAALREELPKERKRIIDRLKEHGLPVKTETEVADIADKILKQIHTGTLTDPETYNILAEKLGLPQYSEGVSDRLAEYGEKIASAPSGSSEQREHKAKMMNYIKAERGVSVSEMFYALYYSHMLSGLSTQLVNAVGNALSFVAEVMTALTRNIGNPYRTVQILRATYLGLTRGGWQKAKSTLKSGVTIGKLEDKLQIMNPLEAFDPSLDLERASGLGYRAVGRYANLMKWVGRAMMAVDVAFYKMSQNVVAASKGIHAGTQAQWDAANNTSRQELLNRGMVEGEKDFSRFQEIRAVELYEEMRLQDESGSRDDDKTAAWMDAHLVALNTTFNDEPIGVAGKLANMFVYGSRKVPMLKLVVPFTRVVANVTNRSLDFTPWGWIRALRGMSETSDWNVRGVESIGDAVKSERFIRATIGTLGLAALLAKAGLHADDDDPEFAIFGRGPKDADARELFYERGGKPYTIKIGNSYYSYLTTPLSVALGAIGAIYDNHRDIGRTAGKKGVQAGEIASGLLTEHAILSILNVTFSQSFLSGLSDLIGAIDSPHGEAKLRGFIGRTAGTMATPFGNLTKQIDKYWLNPEVQQSNNLKEAIQKELPFARNSLNARLNRFGEPITNKGGLLGSRFITFEQTGDPVIAFLAHNNIVPPGFGGNWKIGDRVISDEERRLVVELAGPKIKQMILENMDELTALPNKQEKEDFIKAEATALKLEVIEKIRSGELVPRPQE